MLVDLLSSVVYTNCVKKWPSKNNESKKTQALKSEILLWHFHGTSLVCTRSCNKVGKEKKAAKYEKGHCMSASWIGMLAAISPFAHA